MKLAQNYIHFVPVIANPKDLQKLFIEKDIPVTIVQNFAELKLLKPYRVENRFKTQTFRLIYVGRLRDYYYNIDPVLEAIYLLKQTGVLVYFDLIGLIEPQFFQGFSHLSFWPAIQDQVQFHGELSRTNWLEISQHAQIGICIKNQAEGEVLSHERKLFEYMALGLPSIFCNKQIYTNLNATEPIGIAVDIEQAEAIKQAIYTLMTDENRYAKLAANCLRLSDHSYNWETEFELLLNLYHQLLNKA
jgi:glycosyltransferase involved in cell wall biosynthesis